MTPNQSLGRMTIIAFLRSLLVVPLLAPLGAFAIAPDSLLGAVLFFSLAFGGVAYIVWAVWAWRALGRMQSERDLLRLVLVAPWIFVPIQAATWIVYCGLNSTNQFNAANVLWPMLPFGAYSLVLGYAYSAATWCAYRLASRVGMVTKFETHHGLDSNAA